jgi:hypothetical protein
MARRAAITDSRARTLYGSMHDGLAPRVRPWRPPPTPDIVLDVRRITRIDGVQQSATHGDVLFTHEFEDGTGPVLARDPTRRRNNALLVGGSYTIDDEGMIRDMAKKHHHKDMVRYTNPHSALAFIVQVGLVGFFATVLVEMISGQLPMRWNRKAIVIGRDIALVIAGLWIYKKSPVWGTGLGVAAVVDSSSLVYNGLDLDRRLRNLLRRAPGSTQSERTDLPPSHGLNDGRTQFQQGRGTFNRPRVAA